MAANTIDVQTMEIIKGRYMGIPGDLDGVINIVEGIRRNTDNDVLNRNNIRNDFGTLVSDMETIKNGCQDIYYTLDTVRNKYKESEALLNQQLSSLNGLSTLDSTSMTETNVSNTTVAKPGDPNFIGPMPLEIQLEATGATVANEKTESWWDKLRETVSGWFKKAKTDDANSQKEGWWARLCGAISNRFKKSDKSNQTIQFGNEEIFYDKMTTTDEGTLYFWNGRQVAIKYNDGTLLQTSQYTEGGTLLCVEYILYPDGSYIEGNVYCDENGKLNFNDDRTIATLYNQDGSIKERWTSNYGGQQLMNGSKILGANHFVFSPDGTITGYNEGYSDKPIMIIDAIGNITKYDLHIDTSGKIIEYKQRDYEQKSPSMTYDPLVGEMIIREGKEGQYSYYKKNLVTGDITYYRDDGSYYLYDLERRYFYEYNAQGQKIGTYTSPKGCNLDVGSLIKQTNYQYDLQGRLSVVTSYTSDGENSEDVEYYRYNDDGTYYTVRGAKFEYYCTDENGQDHLISDKEFYKGSSSNNKSVYHMKSISTPDNFSTGTISFYDESGKCTKFVDYDNNMGTFWGDWGFWESQFFKPDKYIEGIGE